jgi:hypothetical protein
MHTYMYMSVYMLTERAGESLCVKARETERTNETERER